MKGNLIDGDQAGGVGERPFNQAPWPNWEGGDFPGQQGPLPHAPSVMDRKGSGLWTWWNKKVVL